MKTPTFIEQYDKIVTAYLKNELDPFLCKACFVGNLLNNMEEWLECRVLDQMTKPRRTFDFYFDMGKRCIDNQSNGLYTPNEIIELERNFLTVLLTNLPVNNGYCKNYWNKVYNQEDRLYAAMESTLIMLREVHESKGEIVENYQFNPRELVS